jgi:tetrahydromethanopterin S-methyltransferase subunit G
MATIQSTNLEKESLEAHVDLCALRYEALDQRLTKVEEKLDGISNDMKQGQNSLAKVIIGAAGTIVAGLLSTIVVVIMQLG